MILWDGLQAYLSCSSIRVVGKLIHILISSWLISKIVRFWKRLFCLFYYKTGFKNKQKLFHLCFLQCIGPPSHLILTHIFNILSNWFFKNLSKLCILLFISSSFNCIFQYPLLYLYNPRYLGKKYSKSWHSVLDTPIIC